MALITLKELYEGYEQGFAVGAFNVHNMEYVQGVMAAAEEENSPVILMVGSGMIKYFGLGWISTLCKHAAANTDLPVVLHLDHATELSTIIQAIQAGFTSVMFDGSHLPFEENLAYTKKVVEIAREAGVSVEGELGAIGGVEDNIEFLAGKMTEPEDAKRFVEETGVDALAVAIGNCHGLYQQEPNLDLERLDAINKLIEVPIVLHGGSDIPDSQMQKAVKLGIRKFNVATDLKVAFTNALRDALSETDSFELPDTLGVARMGVQRLAQEKMRILGCSGQGRNWKNKITKRNVLA